MPDLTKSLETLSQKVEQAFDKLVIAKKQQELAGYQKQMANPDFWQDQALAKEVSVKQAKLEGQIKPWLDLSKQLQDTSELVAMGDQAMQAELEGQAAKLEEAYAKLEFDLKFSGQYDGHDAVVTIQAGAGGTDAQDWAQMLMRMYLRWAERNRMKAQVLDESAGEEAGIKSATLEISGPYAYGRLRSEHGVHRLVRLSPFNSAASRETSFAMVEVVPKIDKPDEVELDEKDLKIDVYRAGGHGGQSVNTTDSAVRVTHLPTGITVSIQNERSQLQNKETALNILRSKLAQQLAEQHLDKIADLKGPNVEAAWGNQIRNYVLHPYTLVKDTRSSHQETDVQKVLDGGLEGFINAFLTGSKQP